MPLRVCVRKIAKHRAANPPPFDAGVVMSREAALATAPVSPQSRKSPKSPHFAAGCRFQRKAFPLPSDSRNIKFEQ